jgi:peptidase E
MRRIVLFSDITNNINAKKVLKAIFSEEITEKRFLLMPSGGELFNPKYRKYYDEWEKICVQYNATFSMVNNSIPPEDKEKLSKEIKKIKQSNILVITGGDPFKLLYHLRRTGMDYEIKSFIKRNNVILAGYSAGAMVLTPTIAITTMVVTNEKGERLPIYEVRGKFIHPGLNNDLRGLHIVDFEIVPHFEKKYANDVKMYSQTSEYEIKTCKDDEFYIIEK